MGTLILFTSASGKKLNSPLCEKPLSSSSDFIQFLSSASTIARASPFLPISSGNPFTKSPASESSEPLPWWVLRHDLDRVYFSDALVVRTVRRISQSSSKSHHNPPHPLLQKSPQIGAKIYLKREDLLHTGAHKINNALFQVLMAKKMGKTRIICETGAGQHGVACATACAMLGGIQCRVYMGGKVW